MKIFKKLRRNVLLLEVLIAFALVILCALPLIAPHIAIVKEQKQFIEKMELDHASHLFYVSLLEQMHTKKIDWNEIQNGTSHALDEASWHAIGYNQPLPYKGSYRFEELRHKKDTPEEWHVHLYRLHLSFIHQRKENEELHFPYTVCLVRHMGGNKETNAQEKKNENSS